MNAACTIISHNYLPYAFNLAQSYKLHNPNDSFFILIVDVPVPGLNIHNADCNVLYVQDIRININILKDMAFRYSILEFNTAVKPYFIEYLYDKYDFQKIIYLDPDMMVFNPLEEVYKCLDQYSIILTPHISDSKIADIGILDENDFLKNGIYNLGFLGTRKDSNTMLLLQWWKKKLALECFHDHKNSLAVDQKWMDLAHAFFKNIHTMKNPGYNMAFWNIHERTIECNNDTLLVNQKHPLVLYHFSSYKIDNPDYILISKNILLQSRSDLNPLYTAYRKGVLSFDKSYFSCKYGFNYFNNGIIISPIYRRLYAKLKDEMHFHPDPFNVTAPDSFYKWLKSERLLMNKKEFVVSESTTKQKAEKIKIILIIHKILRHIMGPNIYFRLMYKLSVACDVDNLYLFYSGSTRNKLDRKYTNLKN